jgi:hypothetical protein
MLVLNEYLEIGNPVYPSVAECIEKTVDIGFIGV